jgi:hypothetical protein
MINTAQEFSASTGAVDGKKLPVFFGEQSLGNPKLDALRVKINSEAYLYEAIQRIALVISNELLDIPQGGCNYERQRKKRR